MNTDPGIKIKTKMPVFGLWFHYVCDIDGFENICLYQNFDSATIIIVYYNEEYNFYMPLWYNRFSDSPNPKYITRTHNHTLKLMARPSVAINYDFIKICREPLQELGTHPNNIGCLHKKIAFYWPRPFPDTDRFQNSNGEIIGAAAILHFDTDPMKVGVLLDKLSKIMKLAHAEKKICIGIMNNQFSDVYKIHDTPVE